MNVKGKKGYLFDVDLRYPEELHDKGYTLGPENKAFLKNMLNIIDVE